MTNVRVKINPTLVIEYSFPEEVTAIEFLGRMHAIEKIIYENSTEENLALGKNYVTWNETNIRHLVQMNKQGIPSKEIAAYFNTGVRAIYTKLSELRKKGLLDARTTNE